MCDYNIYGGKHGMCSNVLAIRLVHVMSSETECTTIKRLTQLKAHLHGSD